MNLIVNGEDYGTAATTLAELLGEFNVKRGSAAAVDAEVVPRSAWGQFRLVAGQRIEILTAKQGG